MHNIWYIHSSSREILAMKIPTHVKDADNTTMQKAMHKTNFLPCKSLQSCCSAAAIQLRSALSSKISQEYSTA